MIENYRMLLATQKWLHHPFDIQTQIEVKELLHGSFVDLHDHFGSRLNFKNFGLMGKIGIGENRVNRYTMGIAAHAVAIYLHQQSPKNRIEVVIGYDNRKESKQLAKAVADILSAHSIKVHFFIGERPLSEVSFAVDYLGCHCGFMISASHHSSAFNGLKLYWKKGLLIDDPHLNKINALIESLEYSELPNCFNPEYIDPIHLNVDNAYVEKCIRITDFNVDRYTKESLSITYFGLNGTTLPLISHAFLNAGFKKVYYFDASKKRADIDIRFMEEDFESIESNDLLFDFASKNHSEIIVIAHPSGDRIKVVVKDHQEKWVVLKNNELILLLSDFILNQWQQDGELNGEQFIATTMLTSPQLESLAASYGVFCKKVPFGFKSLLNLQEQFQTNDMVLAADENGSFVLGATFNEKDALSTTLLVCEFATYVKSLGSSLFIALNEIYQSHGNYLSKIIEVPIPTIEKNDCGDTYFSILQNNLPKKIADKEVIAIEDFMAGIRYDNLTQTEVALPFRSIPLLIFQFNDGLKLALRSRTYCSSIKLYFLQRQPQLSTTTNFQDLDSEYQHKVLSDLNLSLKN